jgi:hypothetical protein
VHAKVGELVLAELGLLPLRGQKSKHFCSLGGRQAINGFSEELTSTPTSVGKGLAGLLACGGGVGHDGSLCGHDPQGDPRRDPWVGITSVAFRTTYATAV